MLDLHLPIADITISALVPAALGGGIGFLSGLLGVGGGFLLTPLLMLVGIPAQFAVATGAMPVMASSVSGALAHWRRGNVDLAMAIALTAGGLVGATVGVRLLVLLRSLGQVDLVIGLCYVLLLGTLGSTMMVESVRTIRRQRAGQPPVGRKRRHFWIHNLPLKMRFRRSQLYISALLPVAIGLMVGTLTAIMGVGGGFVMVPAMIYVLGMRTSTTIGTSLVQIAITSAATTVLQAMTSHAVDVMLGVVLAGTSVIGAQLGARLGAKLPGEKLRVVLAGLVLAVCVQVAIGLFTAPVDAFSVD
ncbi:MAG: sulfite exporter TauE/SafE family protein [Alphaproteobacteria bacterium]|nr:sulfite exporter TauE/SafE family protein [Alphaproteobacteria bacterium]